MQENNEYETMKIHVVHSEQKFAETFTKNLGNRPFIFLTAGYENCK